VNNNTSLRLNEGTIDSYGHFFASACNNPKFASPGSEGILFSLDLDLSLHRVLEDVALPNGIGWNVHEGTIYAFDYAPKTTTMSNR
jgi:sugar lactone lactonase YvrE